MAGGGLAAHNLQGGENDRLKAHVAMTLVGMGYGLYFVLSKASLSGGVNPFVFALYRDGIGCCFLGFYAFVFERQHWPKMTWEVVGLILAMAFIGIYLQQALFLFGLQYTNVVFASTMMNCIPVWTFLIAAVFRLEEVCFKRRDGQAIVLGIISCVSGATIMTLYKGPAILGVSASESPPHLLLPRTLQSSNGFFMALQGWGIDEWKLGSLCLICNSFGCGLFVNLQVPALKRFPACLTLMSCAVFFGAIMFAFTVFFTVKDTSLWIIHPGYDLLAAIYAGTVASGIVLFLQCWSNQTGGPLFVAAYTPVQVIFTTAFGCLFLGTTLFVGSLFGAAFILCGLYLVLWGQRQRRHLQALSLDNPKQTSNLIVPLIE